MKNNVDFTGTIMTIGHSTRTAEDFVRLLEENNISQVVDIRTIPRSRHNPQFNGDSLPATLNEAGIMYQHMAALGGLRHPRANSPNHGWRNASFRGFADYMQTPEFKQILETLISLAKEEAIVLMCAEAVPWRCHRSLIADALLIRGICVEHIIDKGKRRKHVLTPWAKVYGATITYPSSLKANNKSKLVKK